MEIEIIAILFGTAIFTAVLREIYGRKGLIKLPEKTEDSLQLGIVLAILIAIFAVLVNYAALSEDLDSVKLAISLGIAWGIAAPDIAANIFSK